MNPELSTGTLEYTARALLQDAKDAMRENIIQGLVELITNSDDAYSKIGAKRGQIRVEVEHRRGRPWTVVVRDRATGMSHREMRERLATLARRTSGFELGKAVRGNRGRGAKDLVAFGRVTFESIKDDSCARFTLAPTGAWELSEPKRCSAAERDRLGLPHNGTVVTVEVSSHIRCPLHDNLCEKLKRDYRLRFVTTDPQRDLVLVNANNPIEKDTLRYEIDFPSFEKVSDNDICIDGYPSIRAHLTVWRLPDRSDARASDPTRLCGILVRGRRTVYDNTLFGFEGNPYAGWFMGHLDCHLIDDLANEYDDRIEKGLKPDARNPMPIISRRRDVAEGLAKAHPFVEALSHACETVIEALVKEEQERERKSSRVVTNEESRRILSRLAREAARFLQDELRQLDAEDPSVLQGEGAKSFQIVPPDPVLSLGEDKTLSVLAREDALDEERDVYVVADPGGVIEILDGSAITLRPHRYREGIFSGQIHVRPLIEDETLLQAKVGDQEDVILVRVRRQADPPPAEEPETLEFEHPRYRLVWNKSKSLLVRVPTELADRNGGQLDVASDNAGIVVRRGRVSLAPSNTGNWFEGRIVVEGRTLGSKGSLIARFLEESALCRVVVEQAEEDTLPRLKIEPVDEDAGPYRALFDPPEPSPEEMQILKIMTKHPSLRPVIGENFERQDSPEWKAVLAEVVTDAFVRRLMERKFPGGAEPLSANDFYLEMYSYSTRLLPRMQRVLDLR